MSKEPEPEGKTDESKDPETDPNDLSPADVKIILLGDSAVGKTKLFMREFLYQHVMHKRDVLREILAQVTYFLLDRYTLDRYTSH